MPGIKKKRKWLIVFYSITPSGEPYLEGHDGFDDVELDYILMQFTGLLDKNGKEVFEGDILQTELLFDGKPHKVIWEVFWGKNENENMWGWMAKSNTGEYALDDSLQERSKIIGNIYSNPKLLTKNTKKEV